MESYVLRISKDSEESQRHRVRKSIFSHGDTEKIVGLCLRGSVAKSRLAGVRLFDLVEALLNGLDGIAPHGALDSQGLRIAPEVESRDLVHTGNRAVVGA